MILRENCDGDNSDGDSSDGDNSDGDNSDGDNSDGDNSDCDNSEGDSSDGGSSDGDSSNGDSSDGGILTVVSFPSVWASGQQGNPVYDEGTAGSTAIVSWAGTVPRGVDGISDQTGL